MNSSVSTDFEETENTRHVVNEKSYSHHYQCFEYPRDSSQKPEKG